MSSTLRPAAPDDLLAIEALLRTFRLPAEELAAHIENVVVAEEDGRIVGCGGLEAYPEDSACLIRSMAVDETRQAGGLGARILAWVEARADELGLTERFLFTVGAKDFYARHGYEVVGLDAFPPSARRSWQYRAVQRRGEEWGIIAMRKR